MTESVWITGLGVVSPLGCTMDDLMRRVAVGERAASQPDGGALVEEIPVAAVPADKRARLGRLDRLSRLFFAAAHLAADAAELRIAAEEADRIGLSFGTGLGCLLTNEEYYRKIVAQGPAAASPRLFAATVSSAAAGEVSIALGIHGPNVTAHAGLAAGLGAVGYGCDLIRMGKADAVLAGGADAIGPALADGLRDMGLLKSAEQARPFTDAMPGVWPSEGAVVAVLESAERARQRGARCWGRIDGYAAGFEPSLARRARTPRGIAATMRRALVLGGRRADEVGAVFASAHGTPLDATEQLALREVFDGARQPIAVAPKAALGESFGASGVLALALAAGLLSAPRPLATGLTFDLQGRPIAADAAATRLASTPLVMVNALCYAGNVVSLLLSGGNEDG